MSINYRKIAPPDSFIGRYMEQMSKIETATSYDFWCAVWLIGVECGKRCFVDRPRAPVRLNWYIILAAESGITRKSTAVREAFRLVRSDDTLVLSTKITSAGVESTLTEHALSGRPPQLAFIYNELVTILGRESYQGNMPGFLTDIYDGDIRSGRQGTKIDAPFVSFLSASTPSWLITAINPQVVEGGFASRVMFICDEKRKRCIAWPDKEEEVRDDLRVCLTSLGEQAANASRISINDGGLRHFTGWYNKREPSTDSFRASFEAREDDHILRLAACLAINDGSFVIQQQHIKYAIQIVLEVKDRAYQLFAGSYDDQVKYADAVVRVRDVLIEAGMDGIAHYELHRRTQARLRSHDLRVLIRIMHELGMIQVFEVAGTRGKVYRATKNIEQLNAVSNILGKIK